jgi:hypothetical protein
MAAFETYPSAVEPTSRNIELLKTLGTLGLLASPAMLLAAAATGFGASTSNPLVGLLGAAYCLGWLASLAGLHLTGALGRGRLGRRVLGVQAVLVTVAATWSLGEAVVPFRGDGGLPYSALDAAWPLSHLTMAAIGVMALRAGAWTGWARVTPLLCGLAPLVAFLVNVAAWERTMSLAFGLWTCAAFALLAWSVRTSGERLPLAHHSTGSS